jgi:glutathione synthase
MLKDTEKTIPQYIIDEMIDYLYSNGLIIKNKEGIGVKHIPITLYPSPIVKSFFDKIQFYQIAFNKIMDKISRDQQYIEQILTPISEKDEFIKKLLEISKKVSTFENKQKIQCGFFRNDYMVDKVKKFIYQIEFNTIAVSMFSFSDKLKKFYSFFSNKYPEIYERYKDKEIPLEKKDVIPEFSSSLIESIKLFSPENYKNTIIIFVVQENEKNVFDQRTIENELYEKYNILSKRLTLNEIAKNCKVDEKGQISYEEKIISLFYFRAGYTPSDYKDEESWKGREMIELSTAIKVPNINLFLTTLKVFQYELTKPDILKKYINEELISNDIIRFFTKIYYLRDMDKEKQKELFNQITSNPHSYVIKPQREGGGNNYYDEKIIPLLPKDDSEPSDELLNSIIMERIEAPEYETLNLIDEKVIVNTINSEFSVYGVIISSDDKIYNINKSVGFLVRSKDKNAGEGGVIHGSGCVDLPCLMDININKDDDNPISYNF